MLCFENLRSFSQCFRIRPQRFGRRRDLVLGKYAGGLKARMAQEGLELAGLLQFVESRRISDPFPLLAGENVTGELPRESAAYRCGRDWSPILHSRRRGRALRRRSRRLHFGCR